MNAQVVQINGMPIADLDPMEGYVERITTIWRRTKDDVLEIGKLLIAARDELSHGKFKTMLYDRLPFGPDTAQKWMRIAQDPMLRADTYQHLPNSPEALDVLRRMPPDEFQAAVGRGDIHPAMTVEDARDRLREARPLLSIVARPKDSLKAPIVGDDDLIAELKGWRELLGWTGAQADAEARLPDRYTAKIEIGTRHVIHESFWQLIAAYGLAMILVPITGATANRTKCPCCQQPVKP